MGEDDEEDETTATEVIKDQTDFMAYFYLAGTGSDELPHRNNSFLERSLSPKKKKKSAARTRKTISQKDREREFSIPFSSPAGIVVTKKLSDDEYALDRLDSIETYCQAKPTTKVTRTKIRYPQNNTEKTLMRQMRKLRPYYWPRRQLQTKSRKRNFEFLNRWLMEDCKPFDITLNKLTSDDIKSYQERLILIKKMKQRENCVDLISDSDSESVELDADAGDAMTKLNGQLIVASTSSQLIPKYSEFFDQPVIKSVLPTNDDEQFSRRTTTTTIIQQNSVTYPSDVNGHHLNEILEHRTSTKSIHEWLNKVKNVNGETFQLANQLSLINS